MTNSRLNEIKNHIDLQLDNPDDFSVEEVTDEELELFCTLFDLYIKYDKALELLTNFNLPCENDESFMCSHSEWCESHCDTTDESYKVCWDKLIKFNLMDKEGSCEVRGLQEVEEE